MQIPFEIASHSVENISDDVSNEVFHAVDNRLCKDVTFNKGQDGANPLPGHVEGRSYLVTFMVEK